MWICDCVPGGWMTQWSSPRFSCCPTEMSWLSQDRIGNFDSTHLAFAVSYDADPQNHFAGITLSRELTLEAAARVVPRKVAAGAQ